MSKTVVLLWLASGGARAGAQASLDEWAQTRWLSVVEPATSENHAPTYNAALVRRLEKQLDDARLQVATLEQAKARALLTEVERALLKHPELPQAAWLMAEQHRILAELEAKEGNSDLAIYHHNRANALEGPRATSMNQTGSPSRSTASHPVRLLGIDAKSRVFINGVERSRDQLQLQPGRHHLQIRGVQHDSRWVEVTGNTSTIRLKVSSAPACSRKDFEGFRHTSKRLVPARTTRCPHWIGAKPTRKDGVWIAECRRHRCGPFVRFSAKTSRTLFQGPPQPSQQAQPFPLWPVVGTALAAAMLTTVIVWRSGAFDGPEDGKTRWVYTPSQRGALRF